MSGKTSQIFGVILFVAVGVSAIFLSIKQSTQKINSPFAAGDRTALEQLNENDSTVLKTKDTDGDGLSDYDETNVYRTSPYLKDTDSDGLSDGEELKNNTDPNCPQGKTCANPTPVNNQIPSDSEINFNGLMNEQAGLEAPVNTSADALNVNTSTAPTAAEVRAMLINAGLDEQSLKGISDVDLLQLYNDSLKETTTTNANVNGNKNTP